MHAIKLIAITFIAIFLSACAGLDESISNPGYQTARAQSNLEIPPDLINSSDDILKRRASTTENAVLPTLEGIHIRSADGQRWLEIESSADDVWAQLIDFTNKSGLPILSENKQDGILETDWIGDTASETASRQKMRKRLGNLIGRSPSNDRYIFWLEKQSETQTALHVKHDQLKEYVIEPKNQHDTITTGWTETPGDGFKALQLLRRMQAFFAGTEIETENSADVVLIESEPAHIILAQSEDDAWLRVQNALRASTYSVDKIDQDKKHFIIKQAKESGFFSKLAFKSRYAVEIVPATDAKKTRINVLSARGNLLEHADTLTVLYALAAELRRN